MSLEAQILLPPATFSDLKEKNGKPAHSLGNTGVVHWFVILIFMESDMSIKTSVKQPC